MSLRCGGVLLWFVLIIHGRAVKSLESVEELLCQSMEEGRRIPHPEFCNVYVMCTDNAAMQISCESQILYNPETEACDANYKICFGGQIRDQDGSVAEYEMEVYTTKIETTESPETSTKVFSSSEGTTTTTPYAMLSQQPFTPVACPRNDPDNLLLLSHATKCSVYYICYHGKPVPMECSMGLYWSEQNYKCVPKELSECHDRSANQYPKCPADGIDFLPHDENCQRFWYCRDGFRMLQQCDAFYQWDINERKCKRTGQSVCYKDLLKTMTS